MYSFWVNAERFYTFIMPVIVLMLLFLVVVYIFIYSYADPRRPFRKKITRGYLGLILVSLLYFAWGHFTYNEWVNQNEYINPGIRSHASILGIETSEDPSIVRAYRRSNSLKENLLALSMYEATEVTRPFPYDYAGSTESNHYFTYGDENQYIFKMQGEINWTDDERELVGYEFRLTDDRFVDLGFYNEPDTIFDSLSLPESEQKELSDAIDVNEAISIMEMIPGWNFGRQFY